MKMRMTMAEQTWVGGPEVLNLVSAALAVAVFETFRLMIDGMLRNADSVVGALHVCNHLSTP